MGTDIHMIVEQKNDDGKWEVVPNPIRQCWSCEGTLYYKWADKDGAHHPCMSCNPTYQIECARKWSEGPEDWYSHNQISEWKRLIEEKGTTGGWIIEEWYDNRNYDVFAILANVRNGHGFAGVDTGDPWPYIQEGRNVPDDSCLEVLEYMIRFDHTPGWVSLNEIMRYPWDTTSRIKRGVVDEAQYLEWLNAGANTGLGPSSWSGNVSGFMVRNVSNDDMAKYISGALPREVGVNYYTKVSWPQTARYACSDFIDDMKELAGVVGERECRIHFYFDS